MKKYFYFLFVALFATMSFALTSCGDDDDEPNDPTTGKMELTIDGKKYAFNLPLPTVVDNNQYFCLLTSGDYQLSFMIFGWDEVSTGTALTDDNFELNWETIMAMPVSDTNVKVKEKTNKKITISFNNAKFEDARGYDSFTVNGTITLPID